jgi:hypothetical protein
MVVCFFPVLIEVSESIVDGYVERSADPHDITPHIFLPPDDNRLRILRIIVPDSIPLLRSQPGHVHADGGGGRDQGFYQTILIIRVHPEVSFDFFQCHCMPLLSKSGNCIAVSRSSPFISLISPEQLHP